ncbi:two-component system sensor kinase [Pseudonocardia sp. Ae168_Ps1]|nr:putative two-component system sensor kinase [Pseudonocardia sp. Ae150A_Ps1]OLL80488.1 two-component system sensor kinase [Pseudonocardia sp. Ae168_Ps1]OLL94588.1 two-component system sensor kinase [Pseudonocardia sp. Ae356_Ps1]
MMAGVIARAAGTRTGAVTWWRGAGVGAVWFAVGLLLAWALPDIRVEWRGSAGAGPTPASVVALAVASAGTVFRRILPAAGLVLGALAVLAGPLWGERTELGTLLAFTDVLYCAVRYPRREVTRLVVAATAATVAGLAVAALVLGGGRTAVFSIVNLLLVAGVPLVWALEVRRHSDIAEAERARAAEASRAAVRERDAAVRAERARMARDLHDVVAGRLSAIALQSEAALQPGVDPELTRRVLRTVRESGVAALGEMRTMIGLLRDPDTADQPSAPPTLSEVDELVEEARAAGLDARITDGRCAGLLPTPVELTGYRVVQESLTNAAKHAAGSRVTVHLDVAGAATALRIEVRNGPGHATHGPGLHGGTGLTGLGERVAAVGGTFTAGPDGDGWLVRAALPIGEGRPA